LVVAGVAEFCDFAVVSFEVGGFIPKLLIFVVDFRFLFLVCQFFLC